MHQHNENNILPNNGILIGGVLIHELLNNLFASCSFTDLDVLLPHMTHFDDNTVLPFLVFNSFGSMTTCF